MASASPVVNANGVTLTYDGTTYSPSTFVGTTPSYEAARNYTIASGHLVQRRARSAATPGCW